MTSIRTRLCAAALICSVSGAVVAQEAGAGHDMSAMAGGQVQLPEICMAGGGHPGGEMSMQMNHEMDAAHMALMDSMEEMNRQMMTAMMAEDIDVAFVCGMIPHHQSAINMAQAELEHGDDPWARELAQKVIDAQQQEIAEMISWLEQQAPAH